MTTSRPLTREIMAIALPAIIANITTPLLSIMDVAITGHLGSAHYIAAIAVGGTLFNVVYWLMGFLRMGTSGLTAQSFGASDLRAAATTLARSLAVALAIGLLIIVFSRPLCDVGLYFMESDEATKALARRYFMICIWGAPAVLATYSLMGWFLGMQNSRIPMAVSIFVNVTNVALSLLLTGVGHMKIDGVAIGTLTAQWAGVTLALLLLRRNYHVGWLTSLTEIFADGSALRRFFAINRDIFLRTTCLVAVTLWFTRTGSTQGAEILAANTLLMQMFTLFSYFMDGFAYSGEALCGRYYGAGDSRRLAQCVGRLMAIGAMVAAVFTLAGLLLGRHAAEFLTDDTTVIDTAMRYYYPALGVAACGFTAFIFDGVCIGLTRTRDMLGSMVAASAMFFAAWLTLVPRYGNYGLWAAFLLYLTARSVYMATRYAWRR